MLEVSALHKRYGDLVAVQEVSFTVLPGEMVGLLGPNGAGKTTTVSMIAGLTDRAADRVATFSGGMKRRLNLAAALLHSPAILLLDEPTVGVDPQSRNAIFNNLEEFKRQGKTLVYTTHYMEEAERLCDRIIIVDHGKVIANGSLNEVRRLVPATNVLELQIENPGADGWL